MPKIKRELGDTRNVIFDISHSCVVLKMLVNPVLATLKENIFFLKYNLNPPTNASFKSELGTVNPDEKRLLNALQKRYR